MALKDGILTERSNHSFTELNSWVVDVGSKRNPGGRDVKTEHQVRKKNPFLPIKEPWASIHDIQTFYTILILKTCPIDTIKVIKSEGPNSPVLVVHRYHRQCLLKSSTRS